jgi:hypothetical protein
MPIHHVRFQGLRSGDSNMFHSQPRRRVHQPVSGAFELVSRPSRDGELYHLISRNPPRSKLPQGSKRNGDWGTQQQTSLRLGAVT